MKYLPAKITLTPFNALHSEQDAQAFHQQRLAAVAHRLSYAPFVFLTGLTGVGKTTFMRKQLAKLYSIHYGEEGIASWIKDTSDTLKIIFIDEANLELKQWSQFEGLFHQPRTLLFKGQLISLSDQHRVVFAGNPVSYGDDRSLASLFARHGNALVFEPLSLACIYQDILKPVFPEGIPEMQILALCQPILEVYQFLCEHSADEVLITPRELQMMALLLMHASQPPSMERAYALACTIASHALPTTYQSAFNQRFPKPSLKAERYEYLGRKFIITPSRQPAAELMSNILALRQARCLAANTQNEALCYGGLGGILFEGEPGVGKSKFVQKYLIAHGYTRKGADSTDSQDKIYYEIPVSMGLEQKKAALLQAFHSGAVVIIEEINSSPMMEQLLNGLLMGIGPNGERPQKPGFMVIGTQNPITMAGRRAQSTALARRMITLVMYDYPDEELQEILHATIGIQRQDALQMIHAWQKQTAYAKQHHLKPAPCLRDLLNLAKHKVKATRINSYAASSSSTAAHSLKGNEERSLMTEAQMLVQRHYPTWGLNHSNKQEQTGDALDPPYKERCQGLTDVSLKREILLIVTEQLIEAESEEQYYHILDALQTSGALAALSKESIYKTTFFDTQTNAIKALEDIKTTVLMNKEWTDKTPRVTRHILN
ncbi:AAA family ATPase [Legionella worsleiensis]|uniref:AAA domain (Dynein-related subfamily) n=1 Tax=Legionella worsleiensis TaxID=45076 RepID=A0A0W1A3H0_9GAMM|nr:AAA family ATPase [Legionella worsleiensis]KTD75899.1 AAA domain (dynein-related subfamily) [Legionella worsleiensis]STY32912.1 AAA ATPase containing von Willebrand factor type A (vWA) domain [Legionella worsleiensis]